MFQADRWVFDEETEGVCSRQIEGPKTGKGRGQGGCLTERQRELVIPTEGPKAGKIVVRVGV